VSRRGGHFACSNEQAEVIDLDRLATFSNRSAVEVGWLNEAIRHTIASSIL
jgi:hypothetical protein